MLFLLLRISRLSLSPRVSVSSDKTSFWLTINKQLQNVMEKNKNTNNSIQTQLELYIDGRVRSLLSRGFTHGYTSVSGFVCPSVWQHKFNYSFFFSPLVFVRILSIAIFWEAQREEVKEWVWVGERGSDCWCRVSGFCLFFSISEICLNISWISFAFRHFSQLTHAGLLKIKKL